MSAPQSVVLLHGFTGTPRSWDPVLAFASKSAPPPMAVALPGHAPETPPCADFASTCAAVATTLARATAPVHLVGYSLGARIALGTALAFPAHIGRLTLVGVNPGLESDDERRARADGDVMWETSLRRQGLQAFVDAWEAQPIFASQRRAAAEHIAAQRAARLSHDPQALAASLVSTGLSVMPNMWPALCTLAMPAQFIVGDEDAKFLGIGYRAMKLCPRASIVVLPQCGHNPLLEAPAALAGALGL